MCPVCGTPLGLASEAPQANRERALIQRLVDRCMSEKEIKEALVAEYGEEVIALPEAEGFKLTAYLVPAGLLVLTVAGLIVAARRWRGGGRSGGEPAERPLSDAANRRLLTGGWRRRGRRTAARHWPEPACGRHRGDEPRRRRRRNAERRSGRRRRRSGRQDRAGRLWACSIKAPPHRPCGPHLPLPGERNPGWKSAGIAAAFPLPRAGGEVVCEANR